MSARVLSIISTGYRATVEEQDDTVIWLMAMCASSGLDVSLLLRGNAVNYAVDGQDASGLHFGDLEVSRPPTLDRDLEEIMAKGVSVSYVVEDAVDRGISTNGRLISGVKPVSRADLPQLMGRFDQVWHW